jgi:hypothetical protein
MTTLQELFIRGISPFFSVTHAEIIKEVAKRILAGGVYVKYDKETPVAFAIIDWPKSALETPQVIHFYSEGSREQTRALVSHILDKVRDKGYNKLQAINGSSASDEIWQRTFRHKDWEIKPVKTVFEFEVKK